MIRLTLIAFTSLLLSACDEHTLSRTMDVLQKGADAGPDYTVALVEVPEVAPSVEPSSVEPVCEVTLNRGVYRDCNGNMVGTVD